MWREGLARTANQPGFYRCDGGVFRKRLQPGFYRCGPRVQGDLGQLSGHRVSTCLAKSTKRVHNGTSQSGFYRYDGEGAGTQVQTCWSLFIDPLAAPLMRSGGCLERGANRASTGVATIIRRTSSLARAGTGCQPADRILRINRRTPQTEMCQPGFYRCGE